jgi:hypothetical protein
MNALDTALVSKAVRKVKRDDAFFTSEVDELLDAGQDVITAVVGALSIA